MATPYQLPSSFAGGITQAQKSLSSGNLPLPVTSPVLKPEEVKQVKLPQKKVQPTSTDFKNKILSKYPNGVTNDGRRYADIAPAELTKMIADKFPEGVTNEGVPYKDYLSNMDKLSVGITGLERKPGATIAGAIKETGGEMFRGITQPVVGIAKGLYKGATDVADLADLSMEKAPEDRGIIQKTLANVGTGIKELATADIKNLRENPSAGNFGALFNPISEAKVGAAARVVNRGLADFIGSAMETSLTPEAQQTVATTLAPVGAVFETVLSKVPEGDRRDTAEALLNLLPLKVPGAKNIATGAKTVATKGMGLLDNIRTSPVGRPIEGAVSKGIDLATTKPSFLPTAEKAIAKNVDTLTQVNIGTRAKDTIVRNQARGFDPYKDIATHQEALPTVTKEGKIITKGDGNAVSRVEDAIYGINDKLTEAIKAEGVRIPLDEFQARALNSAKQYVVEGDLYNKIIKQIRSDFEVYKRFADDQGTIDLSKINEIKKAKYGRSNYANPDVDLGNKTVGKAAKELVEENTTGIETKAINNEMARWYAVRDLLEAMDGKTVKGGRLGKYSARIAGNIIGSYFGPFGALAGGEISTAIQSGIMKGALKDTGMGIQTPDIVKNLKKKPLELPPSQTSSSKTVDIPTPVQPAQASVLPIREKVLGTSQEVSSNKVNTPIIQKLKESKQTPKTSKSDYLSATEAKITDTELKSLAKKYLETSKLPVGKGRVNSDNMADYKGYARIRDYFKSQGDDSLLESKLPKTPQVEGKTADIIEKARIVGEKEKNNVSMMIQDHAEKIKDKWDELSKRDVRWGEKTTSYKEQSVLESVYKDIYGEDMTEMNIKNYLDTKQSKKLESIFKPKSLPLSQKSEVKYSKPARMLELEKEIQDYTDKFKGLDQKLGLEEAKKQMMPDGKPNEKYIKARDELLEYRWGEDSKGNVTRKMYSDDTPEQIRENQLWLKNNKQKSALPMSQKTDTIYSKGEKPVKIDAMDIEKHGNNRIIYDKKQYKILEEKDVVEQRKPTKSFGHVSPFNIHYKYKLYKVEDMNGKLFDIKDISEPEVIKIERRTDVPIDEKSYKEGVEFYKKRYGLDVTIAQ